MANKPKYYSLKEMLNACYGMTVTDIVRSEIIYACARTAVWSAIFNLKDDYIYCDTDSIKFMDPEKPAAVR